jgi:hypothetical protein
MARGTLIAPRERSARSEQPDRGSAYQCECGHVLWVLGGGRHRVYFELSDSPLGDPAMSRVRPAYGDGLPGENPP